MKVKSFVTVAIVSLAAASFAGEGHDAHNDHKMEHGKMKTSDEMGKHQTLCPVTGEEIDRKMFVDHEGKRAYFCCESCKAEFKKDPAKYLKKLHSQGVVLEDVSSMCPQKKCPVMGGEIDKEHYADYAGKRVYFCCGSCKAAFKKDPEKYLKVLKDRGETPQKM